MITIYEYSIHRHITCLIFKDPQFIIEWDNYLKWIKLLKWSSVYKIFETISGIIYFLVLWEQLFYGFFPCKKCDG